MMMSMNSRYEVVKGPHKGKRGYASGPGSIGGEVQDLILDGRKKSISFLGEDIKFLKWVYFDKDGNVIRRTPLKKASLDKKTPFEVWKCLDNNNVKIEIDNHKDKDGKWLVRFTTGMYNGGSSKTFTQVFAFKTRDDQRAGVKMLQKIGVYIDSHKSAEESNNLRKKQQRELEGRLVRVVRGERANSDLVAKITDVAEDDHLVIQFIGTYGDSIEQLPEDLEWKLKGAHITVSKSDVDFIR